LDFSKHDFGALLFGILIAKWKEGGSDQAKRRGMRVVCVQKETGIELRFY
jgi:hypothetical protein